LTIKQEIQLLRADIKTAHKVRPTRNNKSLRSDTDARRVARV
jgi:hypothetical protein